ncbi:hypothetical protein ACFL5Q_07695 [Planctomycetota bacterium]
MRRLREGTLSLAPPDLHDRLSGQVDYEVREFIRRAVRQENLSRDGISGDEAEQLVTAWISRELFEGSLRDWDDRLPAAASLALEVYARFTGLFENYFSVERAQGEHLVIDSLRRRFGMSDERMVDAALDRIRGRRRYLLDRFCLKYQPSLFGPRTIRWSGIPGYLAKVADVESRKLPFDVLPWNVTADVELEKLADARSGFAGTEYEEPNAYYHEMAFKLRAFWCKGNGFSKPQQWEGMVSAGLGVLADHPDIVRRSRYYLQKRLPAWEEEHDRLRRQSSRLLSRRDHLRGKLRGTREPQLRPALEQALRRLDVRALRLQKKIGLHSRRLRPRPRMVSKILASAVSNSYGVRNRRVRREISLMHERVLKGGDQLFSASGDDLHPDCDRLIRQVVKHLSARPEESASAHGLSPEERERRTELYETWQKRCVGLLAEVRKWLLANPTDCSLTEQAHAVLWSWLVDSEDLFCFGVLSKRGVLEALGRRHGRRLRHLLRTGLEEE